MWKSVCILCGRHKQCKGNVKHSFYHSTSKGIGLSSPHPLDTHLRRLSLPLSTAPWIPFTKDCEIGTDAFIETFRFSRSWNNHIMQ